MSNSSDYFADEKLYYSISEHKHKYARIKSLRIKEYILSKLFHPFELPHLKIKNRIVMAPMTRCRAIGGLPNNLMAKYYAQRASAGLIIAEGTAPDAGGMGYARMPGLYEQNQVDGWKKVTSAVHDLGGKIFLQLMHTGRIAHLDNLPTPAPILAPSAITAPGEIWTDTKGMQPHSLPLEMSSQDIKKVVGKFSTAAFMAMEAGFDGVEIHAANGYLLDQFLNPGTNQRSDDWGGNLEKRLRFPLSVVREVVKAIGAERVGVRLSPRSNFNGMDISNEVDETLIEFARELDWLGISYLHAIRPPSNDDLLNKFRRSFTGILILAGGFNRDSATQSIDEGKCDLIAFGSPFISNPDLVEKLKNNTSWVAPQKETFYTADENGYTTYK